MIHLLALAVLGASTLLLQGEPRLEVRFSSGVAPETVTVGDRFRSVVRVQAPPGARVVFPRFEVVDPLQLTDSIERGVDEDGAFVATYPLAAWIAGATISAELPIRVVLADGSDLRYRVPLPLPVVRSVLPEDTAGLRPKPAKPVIPVPEPEPRSWRWLLLLLPVLALLAAAWAARRWAAGRSGPPRDAREEALREIDRIRSGGLLAAGNATAFYTAITRVLRHFIASVEPRLGEDLTSTELLLRAEELGMPAGERAELEALLRDADPVKFGGATPGGGAAEEFAERARRWIDAYERVPAEVEVAT